MKLKEWLAEISLPVYILVILFGISSWVDINGMWVQLPIFVKQLPEGWNLPSYLVIITQIGNVGALTFFIANRLAPQRVKEWPVVYIIIGIGAVSCMLLAFFWDVVTVVGGAEHSTGLMVLTLFLSVVDCTSSVVYLPFMSVFKPQYMTAFYIGDGLSGLVPGLVGLGQGVGGDPNCVNTSTVIHNSTTGENTTTWRVIAQYQEPNFSSQNFFFFLFALMFVSGISFTLLKFSSFCKRETLKGSHSYDIKQQGTVDTEKSGKTPDSKLQLDTFKENPKTGLDIVHVTKFYDTTRSRDEDGRDPDQDVLSCGEYGSLLFIIFWISLLSIGIINSIQSYAALPYGDLAYNLSVRLGKVSDPLACFLALLLPTSSMVMIWVLTVIATVLMAYQVALASLSPSPPLRDFVAGEIICICTAVLMIAIFAYVRVHTSYVLQSRAGKRGLVWSGFVTQAGALIGAVGMFLVVNVFKLFTRTYPCSN